jgi:electron transfer flavoprotein alpha subunit
MEGVRFLAIAVGAAFGASTEVQQDVEWHGVENQVGLCSNLLCAILAPFIL